MTKKRVLFVDDEERVLSGLRRMLRKQSGDWDMLFVTSGEEALRNCADSPFDVVVTDMRMPGMSGADLLGHLQQDHPETVRMVLSGFLELEAAMRAMPIAHQFLTKPCNPDALRNAIDRACGLHATLGSPEVRRVVGKITTIPVRPAVYSELTAMLTNPDVEVGDIVRVVEQDVGLAAQVLQIVNSGLFGLSRPVSSLKEGVTFIGTTTLKNLAMTVGLYQQLDSHKEAIGLQQEQQHALATARIATSIVRERRQAEDAFMGAMLHDIGRLVMAMNDNDDYGAARRGGRASLEVERKVFGVTHAELGGHVLQMWGLPYQVVEAVTYHHKPSDVDAKEFDILGAVHVANALAHEIAGDVNDDVALDQAYLQAIGMAEHIDGWREQAVQALELAD